MVVCSLEVGMLGILGSSRGKALLELIAAQKASRVHDVSEDLLISFIFLMVLLPQLLSLFHAFLDGTL